MPPQNQTPAAVSPAPVPPINPGQGPSGGVGATIGIIIVVVLLAAGGAYFFYTQQQEQQKRVLEETAAQNQTFVASSTEDSIQNDLNASASSDSSADLDSLQGSL